MIDQAHIDLLSLIQRDVRLKRVAGTHGGEYAGPCPFCGEGEDRLRVWPRSLATSRHYFRALRLEKNFPLGSMNRRCCGECA